MYITKTYITNSFVSNSAPQIDARQPTNQYHCQYSGVLHTAQGKREPSYLNVQYTISNALIDGFYYINKSVLK